MQWTMPPRVLQVVGVLLALVALSAFTLGVVNAPSRGRMPGEKAAGLRRRRPRGGDRRRAAERQDRIEGAFQPRELTPEEKEKAQEEKEAKQEAADAAKAAAATAPPGAGRRPRRRPSPPRHRRHRDAAAAAPSPDEAPH